MGASLMSPGGTIGGVVVDEVLLLAVPIVVGLVLSLLITWTPRPVWLTKTRVFVSVMAVALVASVVVAVTSGYLDGQAEQTSPAPTSPPAGGVKVPERFAAQRVLSTDDSSGDYVLFVSRLDGTNRQRVADFGGRVVPVSDSLVVRTWSTPGAHARLEVSSVTGEQVRALTNPDVSHDDQSPSYAAAAGEVYFVRARAVSLGEQSWTYADHTVLRVRLDGSRGPELVSGTAGLISVSTDDSGTVIAGECADEANVGGGCLVVGGRQRRIPGSEGTTMSDIEVSPDGRFVAYSSFQANQYGVSQVYVYEIASDKTVTFSRLEGLNSSPSWARGTSDPCLLFTHDLTGYDPSVHFGCLGSPLWTVPALPVGSFPRYGSRHDRAPRCPCRRHGRAGRGVEHAGQLDEPTRLAEAMASRCRHLCVLRRAGGRCRRRGSA